MSLRSFSFPRGAASRLLLGAALLSGLAGCERKSSGTSDTGGDIVIGMYGSLTGNDGSFGQSSKEGTQLAVDEINATPEAVMKGRKFQVLIEDDQSKPEEASSA